MNPNPATTVVSAFYAGYTLCVNALGGLGYQKIPSVAHVPGANNTVLLTNAAGVVDWDTVDTAMITPGAVTAVQLGSSSVTTTKIFPGAVTSNELGNGVVTTSKIALGAVTATELGSSSVTTSKIFPGAVTNSELGNASVTVSKVSPGSNNTVMSTNGSGAVGWTTVGTAMISSGGNDSVLITSNLGVVSWIPRSLLYPVSASRSEGLSTQSNTSANGAEFVYPGGSPLSIVLPAGTYKLGFRLTLVENGTNSLQGVTACLWQTGLYTSRPSSYDNSQLNAYQRWYSLRTWTDTAAPSADNAPHFEGVNLAGDYNSGSSTPSQLQAILDPLPFDIRTAVSGVVTLVSTTTFDLRVSVINNGSLSNIYSYARIWAEKIGP